MIDGDKSLGSVKFHKQIKPNLLYLIKMQWI